MKKISLFAFIAIAFSLFPLPPAGALTFDEIVQAQSPAPVNIIYPTVTLYKGFYLTLTATPFAYDYQNNLWNYKFSWIRKPGLNGSIYINRNLFAPQAWDIWDQYTGFNLKPKTKYLITFYSKPYGKGVRIVNRYFTTTAVPAPLPVPPPPPPPSPAPIVNPPATTTPPSVPLPTISSFTSNFAAIAAGGTVTLSWNVKDAAAITINPGGVNTALAIGSYPVTPTVTTTYTLTATNSTGTTTAQVTVMVNSSPPPQNPPPPSPSISASPASTAPGGTVTVTVSNGPGNATDWVGMYRMGAPGNENPPNWEYLDWKYLNGGTSEPSAGQKNAALTFTVPNGGSYQFRFFANNDLTLLATSQNVKASPYIFLADNNGPHIDTAAILPLSGNNPFLQGTATGTPWTFAQWGNPYPMTATTSSPNIQCTAAPAWANATPNSRICWIRLSDGTYKVEIAQAGSNPPYNLDCGTGNTEFALLLGNNPYESPAEFRNSPYLDKFNNVLFLFNFQWLNVSYTDLCPGGASGNVARPLAAVVLGSTGGQVLFYKVQLSIDATSGTNNCWGNTGWYWSPSADHPTWWGVDDYLNPSYNVSCPPISNQTTNFNLDFLPRLIYLIQNSSGGMDKDISHWQIQKYYFGSHVFGGGIMTTLWDHIGLTGQLK